MEGSVESVLSLVYPTTVPSAAKTSESIRSIQSEEVSVNCRDTIPSGGGGGLAADTAGN